MAFPSISTGVYGYPVGLAAEVAIGAVADILAGGHAHGMDEVRFVLFDERTFAAYADALDALAVPG